MHRNLRFYSMIAALATVYAMTPNRAAAITCADATTIWESCGGSSCAVCCNDFCPVGAGCPQEDYDDCVEVCGAGVAAYCPSCGHGSCSSNLDCSGTYNTCTDGCCVESGGSSNTCSMYPYQSCSYDSDCTTSGYGTCYVGCCWPTGTTAPSSSCARWLITIEDIQDMYTEGPNTVCASKCDSSACNGIYNGTSGNYVAFPQNYCASGATSHEDRYQVIEYCEENPCYSQNGWDYSNLFYSCNQCQDGYDLVPLKNVLGMTMDVDYSMPTFGTQPEVPVGITNPPTGEYVDISNISSNLNVCVTCLGTTGNWTEVYVGSTPQHRQSKTTTYHANCNKPDYVVYRCSEGYYTAAAGVSEWGDNGISAPGGCIACPSHATCPAGSDVFQCDQGYYRPNIPTASQCEPCPNSVDPEATNMTRVQGLTNSSGKTDIAECYQSKDTRFKDNTGWYKYTNMCYYSTANAGS